MSDQNTKRQIARKVLKDLFGPEYFQAHSERLLEKLANATGDHQILKKDTVEDLFENIFGGHGR